MKRKLGPTNPNDQSPTPSSKNQFKTAKGDEAKTSEYAFFQKLKKDSNHFSDSLPPDSLPPKLQRKSEIKNGAKELKLPAVDVARDVFLSPPVGSILERKSKIQSGPKELKLPAADVARDVFLSAPVDLTRASTNFGNICSTSTRCNVEECYKSMRPKGTQAECQDLFSMKRQKLRQWVAEISFPGVEELYAKGCDFVNLLLSRLFPESNKDKSFEIPSPAQAPSKEKFKCISSFEIPSPAQAPSKEKVKCMSSFEIPSPAQALSKGKFKCISSPSPIDSKYQHKMSTGNFLDVQRDPYVGNRPSVCWFGRPIDGAQTNLHFPPACWTIRSSKGTPTTLNPDHVYSALHEFTSEPIHELGERNAMLWIDNGSPINFPFSNYGYWPTSYHEEPGGLHYPEVSLLERKEHALLLGWDSEQPTDATTTLTPYSLASWSDSHDRNVDRFGGNQLCASPLICKLSPSFYPLMPPDSTHYFRDEFKRQCVEERDDIYPADHCPLSSSWGGCSGRHYMEDEENIAAGSNYTLLHRPSYLHLTEGSDQGTSSNAIMDLCSPGDHPWFKRKFHTKRYGDQEMDCQLSSKLDFDLGRKCLSISDSSIIPYASSYPAIEFTEKGQISSRLQNVDEHMNLLGSLSLRAVPHDFSNNVVKIEDLSSFDFQISLPGKITCPLLLDRPSWDGELSEEQLHHSNKYNWLQH